MPDLIAQGTDGTDRWRKALPANIPTFPPVILGRTSEAFEVPWDSRVSRQHAKLVWDGQRLHVERHVDARNPIFFRGKQDDEFSLQIGEHFVIGGTTFTLANQQIEVSNDTSDQPLVSEQSFTTKELDEIRYRDAQRRIDALSRLPSVIGSSTNDEELVVRVLNVLMTGIRHATFIAIVKDLQATGAVAQKKSSANSSKSTDLSSDGIQILHWDSRDLNRRAFSPSRSLIRRANTLGQSVLHTWHNHDTSADDSVNLAIAHTEVANVDWAFCVPIQGEGSEGWSIYVAGKLDQLSDTNDVLGATPQASSTLVLHEEMKFTELTATTIAAVRQARYLQQRQDVLRPFFAPVVRKSILRRGSNLELQPREADVSVLFCDLRGFSEKSELLEDQLLVLLQRVSDALGVTTKHILMRDGVVGDFHGDAAMGFWGWPLDSDDYILKAVSAALAIHAEFEDAAGKEGNVLSGFRAGLGVASGRAVAGQIGTVDQVKITVFGPVVNLASRLESMTKQLFAPILVDEATAEFIRKSDAGTSARVRRVAKVLPVGMKRPLVVSELLPPSSTANTLSDIGILAYERALDSFLAGQWEDAFRLLYDVPASDRVKDFLTVYIAQHGRRAPANWDGVIHLQSK